LRNGDGRKGIVEWVGNKEEKQRDMEKKRGGREEKEELGIVCRGRKEGKRVGRKRKQGRGDKGERGG